MAQAIDLSGKVAFVTGASSGLGVQFARALAKAGASIVLVARREEKLKAVEEEIRGLGADVMSVVCDVTSVQQVKDAVAKAKEKFGKIDILVNNAGVSEIGPAEGMTDEQWKKVIDTNLTAVFTVAREVGKEMVAAKYGKIINISSMYGVVANLAFPVVNYHASKFGVVGITKALAAEWAKYGITVNAIGPGFFESEMTQSAISTAEFQGYVKANCPMGRIGAGGELDGTLLLFASDLSSYITGQIMCVDGGWTAV